MLGEWGLAELAFGIFAASVVVMPKFLKYISKKPIFVKIGSWLPTFDLSTTGDEKSGPAGRASNRNGLSLGRRGAGRVQVTDREYNELVANSLQLSASAHSVVSRKESKDIVTAKVNHSEPEFITVADSGYHV